VQGGTTQGRGRVRGGEKRIRQVREEGNKFWKKNEKKEKGK